MGRISNDLALLLVLEWNRSRRASRSQPMTFSVEFLQLPQEEHPLLGRLDGGGDVLRTWWGGRIGLGSSWSLLPSLHFPKRSAPGSSGCTRKPGCQLPLCRRLRPHWRLIQWGLCRLQTSGVWQRGGWRCSCLCRGRRVEGRAPSLVGLQCWWSGAQRRACPASRAASFFYCIKLDKIQQYPLRFKIFISPQLNGYKWRWFSSVTTKWMSGQKSSSAHCRMISEARKNPNVMAKC